jgi:hypothetical protein
MRKIGKRYIEGQTGDKLAASADLRRRTEEG